MRLLFTGLKTNDLVNMNVIYYLEQELAKHAECKWSGPGWPEHKPNEYIDFTVRRLYGNDPPDFIVSNRPNLDDYLQYKINKQKLPPIISTLADIHVNPSEWIRLVNEGSDGVLMRYLYCPYKKSSMLNMYTYYSRMDDKYYQKNIKKPILHFPWFTDPLIYSPSNEKTIDVTFLGAYRKKVYPLINKLVKELPGLCSEKKWSYLIKGRPPGKSTERNISKLLNQGYIVGKKYAETLASSKVFIFGNSIFHYPLSKYFEVMGSGTLVMANKPQSAEQLHFISGENYVEITNENWREELEYYLDDDEERERIANNGYKTVMKYHNTEVRAKQFLQFLKQIKKDDAYLYT